MATFACASSLRLLNSTKLELNSLRAVAFACIEALLIWSKKGFLAIASRVSPTVFAAPVTPSKAFPADSTSLVAVLKWSIKKATPAPIAVINKIHGWNALIKVPAAVPRIAIVPVKPTNAALKVPILGASFINPPPTSIIAVPERSFSISMRNSLNAAVMP